MRTIKEGFLRKNLGLGKDALIKNWLNKYKITNYTINKDFTIDVDGDVSLDNYDDEYLPDYIQFRTVSGDMRFDNSNIKSLRGCPAKVGDHFSLIDCNQLTSLEYAPTNACNIYIVRNEKLKSLKGLPYGAIYYIWDNGKKFEMWDVKKEIHDVKSREFYLEDFII